MSPLYEKIKDYNQSQINVFFTVSCRDGHMEPIKYLLTSADIKIHAEIDYNSGSPINLASAYGQLTVVKYLLESPELSIHSTKINLAFESACNYNHMDIIQYLIFDLNMEKTKSVENYLLKHPNSSVDNLFTLKEINNNLKNHLISENESNKRKPKL